MDVFQSSCRFSFVSPKLIQNGGRKIHLSLCSTSAHSLTFAASMLSLSLSLSLSLLPPALGRALSLSLSSQPVQVSKAKAKGTGKSAVVVYEKVSLVNCSRSHNSELKELVADQDVFSRPVDHESYRRIASILTGLLRGTGGDTACC